MAQRPSTRYSHGYTVAMLRRLGLLTVPAVALALLGASIVLAQQGLPGGEGIRVVAPQATPGPARDGPVIIAPTQVVPNPTNPTNNPNTNPNPPANNQPANPQQNPQNPGVLPQQGMNSPMYLVSNIPPELRQVPEAKPVPSGPNVAALTAAGPELRALREAAPPPSQQNFGAMTIDGSAKPAVEAKPVPSAPNIAALTAVSPNLMPVLEAPPVITR